MLGPRSRLSLMVLFVPACLLVASATVRVSLMQPWTMWQPPVLEPWLPGAQPPPPEQVGHALFGGRLYGPATVLARATLAGNLAMATLAAAAVALFLLHRFSVLMVRPSNWGPLISTAARWTLRASSLFAVLYVAEVLAIVYFAEVLTYGAVTFITPAYTLIVLFATAAYLFKRWQSPRPEMPPPRLNGRPLDRGTQAALFAALDEAARSAAGASAERAIATLEPPVALISGPVNCGELVHGYLLLLPLPLCAVLTIEELRALAAQQYAPLRWHGGPYAKQIDRVHCEARARMAPPDSVFGRLAFLLPGTGFCALALRPAEGFEQLVAGAAIETDRIAAARFGSVDLARGLLKTYAAFALWPRFRYEMAAELKRWEQTPQPHPYELIGRRFAEFLTPERVAPVLAQAPELRERLARIGQPLMMDLDLAPAEPALGVVREAEAIDRALSAAERVRMVFERPAAAAQRARSVE